MSKWLQNSGLMGLALMAGALGAEPLADQAAVAEADQTVATAAAAAEPSAASVAQTEPAPVQAEAAPVVTYRADGEFEEVLENVKWAVTDRGLLVSGTLHVQEMLVRTGSDLGFADPVYQQAESVEFCSALMSHRMIAADPRNLVVCPFTIAVYVLASEPDQVYVAYRRQLLAGDSAAALQAVTEMVDGIAREAAE